MNELLNETGHRWRKFVRDRQAIDDKKIVRNRQAIGDENLLEIDRP